MQQDSRVIFLDWLRVIACLMVILVHSIEPFYLGGEGTLIKSWGDGFWSTVLDSPLRAAVPLFVMASSYLLFPLKYGTGTFFRKRFSRVAIPLIVWSVLYAVVPMYGSGGTIDMSGNLKNLTFNFIGYAGHLWFVYMLIGLYLLMPMLSPWIERVTKKEEEIFLGIWLFTTLIPLVRPLAEEVTDNGMLWGEALWNEFGAFYYVSGFIGYLVLGHYFRTYAGEMSWKKTLAIALPLWAVGYAITAGGFWWRMPKEFPVSAPIDLAVEMETTWRFCTIGVALTTIAYFMVIRKITSDGRFYRNIILPISRLSYGIYLMHMFVLVAVLGIVGTWGMSTPLTIFCTAAITFVCSAVIARLISFIPKSKYLIG